MININLSLNSQKGITIVSLVITIVILLILTGVTITNLSITSGTKEYNKMVADIELIKDEIFIYFNKYNEIPKTDRLIKIKVDGVGYIKYYEIDLSKLEGLTLNYGNDYGKEEELTEDSDVYLVNSSLHVYYLKGVEKNKELHHYVENNENYIASDITPEYTELEYIESTGTQYIDTGIYGDTNIKADLLIEATNKNNVCVIGTDNYVWKNEYVFQLWNNNFYAFKSTNTKALGDNTMFKIHLDPTGESVVEGIGSVNSGMTEIANTKIYIAKWGSYLSAFKMYSCKFYENDTLIRDFIPCKDKNDVVCMYDKVEGKYYYNQGTGDFVAGPEV